MEARLSKTINSKKINFTNCMADRRIPHAEIKTRQRNRLVNNLAWISVRIRKTLKWVERELAKNR